MTTHLHATTGPVVERTPVEGTCDRCGEASLTAYPVLSEGGWFKVVKCQTCLHSVERTRWSLLGPVSLTSEGIAIA
ncbi:hypothetical protein D0Z08_05395 [Nocardioides immobilis]|uniref:Uncharacterized protein n=1 Tax=Nocardioides immobilis TaxID=2049295 RepID=A0A417Y6X6_9ACTN|nr:hypothetical protein D0Z08_05395 [Nocardioides immobilis]